VSQVPDTEEAVETRFATMAIQVVLYDNDVADLVRLAGALGATARHARDEADLGHVVVRFGDSSRWPNLTGDDERTTREAIADAADGAVAETSFTFFGANLGSGGGSNALAAQGDDDVIWVINPDTYPAPTCAAELLAALRTGRTAVAEARQIPIEHQKEYDPVTGETGWACGACVMFRRAAFDEVGGFDAHFFPLYCDDVDISWRLRHAGWSVRHVPRGVVFHDKEIGPGGALSWSDTAARSNHLARLWLYHRYGRPDLVDEFIAGIDPATDPIAGSAIDEYRSRVTAGDAPEPLIGAEHIAQFVDGQYAPRRFSYATP
jgi:GT2 family glycosyltransferase